MNEEHRTSETERGTHGDGTRPSESPAPARMGARRWVIAANYSPPAAHGIPELPDWTVRRTDAGGLALAAGDDSAPFVTAQNPMRVRR